MTERIAFTVPGEPIPQPRQRHGIRRGRSVNYLPDDHPVHGYKIDAAIAARSAHQGQPLTGPLAMRIAFILPRPTAKIWKRKPMPREPHCSNRNDWDNLGKSLCDALNGIVYRDDGQLADVHVTKWIAAGDEPPHTSVEISRI